MNEYFPQVDKWSIPESALRYSIQEMAIDGRLGNEGVVLWLGRRCDGNAILTHLIRLRGPGVTKHPDLLLIDSDLMNDVADIAIDLDVQLIGQIHSHGPRHGVNLSATDLQYGIAVPGYLSVVAPDYAMRSGTTFGDCGVHVCDSNSSFRRLAPNELNNRIETVSADSLPFLTVGGNGP
jgi:hypothetical protein